MTRRDERATERKKLIMAIYKRTPIGNKMLREKKHIVMFSGVSAKEFGVENFTNVALESLTLDELKRAAIAVGAA